MTICAMKLCSLTDVIDMGFAENADVRLGVFRDIFGTDHQILLRSNARNSHLNTAIVQVMAIRPGKTLVRLPCPTTNGVQEAWVESSRLLK